MTGMAAEGARRRRRSSGNEGVASALLPRQRQKIAEYCRDELRYRGMDVHGALEDGVGRLGIHGVEQAVDHLIAAGAEERGAEDLPGFGIDQHLHEPLGLAL